MYVNEANNDIINYMIRNKEEMECYSLLKPLPMSVCIQNLHTSLAGFAMAMAKTRSRLGGYLEEQLYVAGTPLKEIIAQK